MIYRRRKSHEACNTKMSGSQCFCGWKTVGAIEKGLMVLIGVGKDDTTEVVDKYLKNYYSYGSLKMRTARQIVL